MRCWMQFREKAGGTKEGITYHEFNRGLRNYGLHLKEPVSHEMFDRMDTSKDGYDTPIPLTAEQALGSLRRKIGQRLKGGPYGLQRCWMQFRERCGGSKEGIAFEEWERGLKLYDLILDENVSRELFNRMDQNGDGNIHMREFVDNVMGRWSSDITSLPAHRPKTSHTAAAKVARPGSVPANSGARVPPLPGIGVSGTATAQRSTQYPGTKRTVKKRAAGATNGGEYDAMRSIGDKMPAASSALAALHRAMHAAENGAGKGTLP